MKAKVAWAVIASKRDAEEPGQLVAYGNGKQWQYPVFWSRTQAMEWKRKDPFNRRGMIVRVEIREK